MMPFACTYTITRVKHLPFTYELLFISSIVVHKLSIIDACVLSIIFQHLYSLSPKSRQSQTPNSQILNPQKATNSSDVAVAVASARLPPY